MTIEFEVKCSKGIEFYYQGELTAEEIKEGHVRPDDIVGSYAVYCNKSNNQYKTGKLCHIPRPFVIDAKGNKEWCVQHYDKKTGILAVTLPSDFMKNADYALGDVRLDPTIGYISNPATAGSYTSVFELTLALPSGSLQAASSGTAKKIWVYVPTSATGRIEAGFYDNSSPKSRLVAVNQTDGWTADAWNSMAISDTAITSGNDYYPAVCFNATTGYGSYDSTTPSCTYRSAGYNALPATTTGTVNRQYVWGVYIEYTESASGSVVPIIMQSMNQFRGGMI
jgi:hypothetical protein